MAVNIETLPIDDACKAVLRKLKAHGFYRACVPYTASQSVVSASELSYLLRHGGISTSDPAMPIVASIKSYETHATASGEGEVSFQLNITLAVMRRSAHVSLRPVFSGNPFEDHPQLRSIWSGDYATWAENQTVRCLENPEGRKVFLIVGDDGCVVGITGYYFYDDSRALGLRWHGVVSCMQRHFYSRSAIDLLCTIGKSDHPDREVLVELMPVDEVAQLDKPFRRHGFLPVGGPIEEDWLMPGKWQGYERLLPKRPAFGVGPLAR